MNAVQYLLGKREITPSDIFLQGSEYERVIAVLERFVNRSPQEFHETCEEVLSRYGMDVGNITHRPHASLPEEDEVDYNKPGPSTVSPLQAYAWEKTVIVKRGAA